MKSWRGPVIEITAVSLGLPNSWGLDLRVGVRASSTLAVIELRSNLGSLPEKSTRKTRARHAQGSKGQSHARSGGKGQGLQPSMLCDSLVP